MPLSINGTTGISGVDGSVGTPAVQGSDTNTGVYFPAADTYAICTNGSERYRVQSNGEMYVGGTSWLAQGSLGIAPFYSQGSCSIGFNRASTANTSFAMYLQNGGAGVGSISYTNTATAFNTSSDHRLKENVVPLSTAIDRLQDLKPVRFNFIVDPNKTVDGFIAHEVQAVVPEAITGTKDEVDDDGNPVYQGIDQSKLVPLLTAALQEALTKIEMLETRIAALEVNP